MGGAFVPAGGRAGGNESIWSEKREDEDDEALVRRVES